MLRHSVMSDSLHLLNCSLRGSSCPWNSLSKNNGVGCHALLQGIFPTQGLTQVSCIAGGFFTVWATREALKLPSSSLNWLEWILMDKVISNRDGFSGEGNRKLRLVVWLGWMWRHWGSNYDQRMELSSERCLNIYTQTHWNATNTEQNVCVVDWLILIVLECLKKEEDNIKVLSS